jgi:hypothetical protein
MKRFLLIAVLAAALLTALVSSFGTGSGADHADGPVARTNASLDIADVYTMNDGSNIAFIVTVNGLSMPGDTPTFHSDGSYQIKVDSTGDAIADVSYNVDFGIPDAAGIQSVIVRRNGREGADTFGTGGVEILTARPPTRLPRISPASSATETTRSPPASPTTRSSST